jgi:PAS domain S-box-containing protein
MSGILLDPNAPPLRVLVIEDDPVYATLLSAWLEKEGRGLIPHRIAATLEEARLELARGDTDLLLADLNLPDSQGIETLTALMEAYTLPIVVLTASSDTHLAKLAMEAGAQDYLVKGEDKARHVVRSISYAVERYRHLTRMEHSERRFRDFAEISSDWFWELDPEFRYSWVSGHVREVMGFEPSEMTGMSCIDIISEDEDAGRVAAHAETLSRHDLFRNFTFRPSAAPHRYLRASGKPVLTNSGKFLGYRGVGVDVTDEMESQIFAARMLAILTESIARFPSGVLIFDPENRLLMSNDRAWNLLMPDSSDVQLSMPGTPFADILRATGVCGHLTLSGTPLETWLSDWAERSRKEDCTVSEPTVDGKPLRIQQYNMSSGWLRIIDLEP